MKEKFLFRFKDFDLKKLRVESEFNDVGPVLVGPSINNLLGGIDSNRVATALDTCSNPQIEATPKLGELPSDIILNSCKQPIMGIGSGVESATGSSNHSSTLDTESFHTVCNNSSSASIVGDEPIGENPTQPCSNAELSESLGAGVNHTEADSKALEADDDAVESSSTLKSCTLYTCGVVLTIQSPDTSAVSCLSYFHFHYSSLNELNNPVCSKVYKAKEALGEFLAKGNKLRPLKVVSAH